MIHTFRLFFENNDTSTFQARWHMDRHDFLDQVVGREDWPGPVEEEYIWADIKGDISGFMKAVSPIIQGIAKAHSKTIQAIVNQRAAQQSSYVLWPPPMPDIPRFTMPSRRDDQRLNNEFWQAQFNRRAKQLSRPIGSRGCGFVWNRGRFT